MEEFGEREEKGRMIYIISILKKKKVANHSPDLKVWPRQVLWVKGFPRAF